MQDNKVIDNSAKRDRVRETAKKINEFCVFVKSCVLPKKSEFINQARTQAHPCLLVNFLQCKESKQVKH